MGRVLIQQNVPSGLQISESHAGTTEATGVIERPNLCFRSLGGRDLGIQSQLPCAAARSGIDKQAQWQESMPANEYVCR